MDRMLLYFLLLRAKTKTEKVWNPLQASLKMKLAEVRNPHKQSVLTHNSFTFKLSSQLLKNFSENIEGQTLFYLLAPKQQEEYCSLYI